MIDAPMTNIIFAVLVGVVMVLTYRLVTVLLNRRQKPPERKRAGERKASSKPPLVHLARAFDESDDPEITKIRLPQLHKDDGFECSDEPPDSVPGDVPIPIIFDEEADVDVATSESAHFLLTAVGQSEQGRRKRNEDAYLVLDDPPVVAVADGMGGYRGGDLASAKVVDVLEEALTQAPPRDNLEGLPSRAVQLLRAVHEANSQVFAIGRDRPELKDMGTTVVAARFSPRKERVYIAHVGDSRCYVFRADQLRQITTDHTVGAIYDGALPIADHLVRAVGVRPNVEVDLILGIPVAGDRYILCSDGLSRALSANKIAAILRRRDSPSRTARRLVRAADKAGSTDNITVIVVDVEPAMGRRNRRPAKRANGDRGPDAA